MTFIWSEFFILWEIRCADRHGRDAASRDFALRRRLDRELGALYSQRHLVLACDRDLFQDSLEDHLNDPVAQIHQWVSTWGHSFLNMLDFSNEVGLSINCGRDHQRIELESVAPVGALSGHIATDTNLSSKLWLPKGTKCTFHITKLSSKFDFFDEGWALSYEIIQGDGMLVVEILRRLLQNRHGMMSGCIPRSALHLAEMLHFLW